MVKNLVYTTAMVVASVVSISFMQASSADAIVTPVKEVTFCHSRQPQPSQGGGAGPQDNPYGPSAMTVSVNAFFNAGHDIHDGPIFNNTNQNSWGDIIPPFTYEENVKGDKVVKTYPGMNWPAGQAILNADCQYTPVVTAPDTSVAGVCNVDKNVIEVTFTNNGTANSNVSLGATSAVIAPKTSQTLTTPITGASVTVTYVVDGQSKALTVTCPAGGSGNETPKVVSGSGAAGAAVTQEVASLPVTSGSSDKLAALVVMAGSVIASVGAYFVRMRSAMQL